MKRIDNDAFYEYIKQYDPDSKNHLIGEVSYHLLCDGNKMPKYAQKSKKFISEKLIARIPAETLNEQISEELFERDYTIYD